jgi:REP element-mobilizing transposase RayT
MLSSNLFTALWDRWNYMSVHTQTEKEGIYFITFTCHEWLPLIELSEGYSSVYNFFQVLRTKGHAIVGYVIMPNHLHFLLHYTGKGKSLNTLIGNGKRFMAYEMIKRLDEKGELHILNYLQNTVLPKDLQKGQKHNFWKDSFEVKECRTENFLLQKLHYTHNNPVRGKWKLVASAQDYLHSSASFYFNGRQQVFEVKDYRELLKWDEI